MASKDDITYFAEADFRNKRTRFGIKRIDRARHMYIIGKTGMGKSTLLENMAIQDIQNGEGVAIMDPHGSMAEKLLDYVPENRVKDVIYFAPFDSDFPLSFNVMEDVGYDKRHLVASGLMSAFKKIWQDAWSGRMEYILTNTILALLEYPDATLLGVNRMLSDKEYRKRVVENVSDPAIKSFWTGEFAKYNERYMQEAGDAIKNKVGQFTANPVIRNVIGQPHSSFDIRKIMDEKKILIMNLSKGRIGEQNSNLLGSMLVTKIYLAAMSRADVMSSQMMSLPDFYLYVDEFQSFANESFADILSEARKYKLNLTIAHQYVEQMPEEVRAAVFGNVGTMAIFRIGSYDAEIFEKEFAPEFTSEDIVNLGFAQIYIKLMIDGIGSKPFSAQTLPPIPEPPQSFKDKIIDNTRQNYARPRTVVEEDIRKWHEPVSPPASGGGGGPIEPVRSKISHGGGTDRSHQKEERGEERRQHERRGEEPKHSFTPPQVQPKHDTQAKAPARVPEHIPLAHLSRRKDKGPSVENKMVLKEALEKASSEREEPVSFTGPSAAKPHQPLSGNEGPKEVSEAELKKVFE